MMDLTTTDSTLKRRAFIALTIVPFAFYVAAQGAYGALRAMWASAAFQWQQR